MNAPVAAERKSFLPLRVRSTTVTGTSSIPIRSRSRTPVAPSTSLAIQNDTKSSLIVGNRVLVNGLKSGTLRYIDTVQFAEGLFCGVELDESDGKHDGKVNDIRYFKCKPNHGIFVPHDKVVLAPRERASSSQRTVSRLKPPTIARSMTLSNSINKIEQTPIPTPSKPVQLPDIVPSPTTIEIVNDPIIHKIIVPVDETKIKSQPITIEEPLEIIEADFTDSVSLILHQLQQEQQPILIRQRSSIAISEEGTVDDDDDEDDDDTDELDNESITESTIDEQMQIISRLSCSIVLNPIDSTKFVQTDLTINVNDNITIVKNNLKTLAKSNKSLSGSTISVNKLKINTTDHRIDINKKKAIIPAPVPVIKKDPVRKAAVPSANISLAPRKSSLIPPKHSLPSSINKLNSVQSVASLGSQSKLNSSPSSSNSINSSQSDLTSTTNNANQPKPSKMISRPASGTTRAISHSIDLTNAGKKLDSSRRSLDVTDHQAIIQKIIIQSLEVTNDRLKKQYQHLLNQFELMCVLNQYYINENEQIKQRYELNLTKGQTKNNRLKTMIEQIRLSNKKELATIDEQHLNQVDILKETHQKQFIECQQQIEKLLNEKSEYETRCTALQERVDGFMEEMANSEHADLLLCHVETLEKDRTSLQTVLEMKNQEVTHLRTKINEQVFQREDQLALQKRIDMAENRNQDLGSLLRHWQLNEKTVAVERDQLKEQVAHLERDNCQLSFENETLLYRLHQRPSNKSITPTSQSNSISSSTQKLRNRTSSFSTIKTLTHENERIKRSLSLNGIFNR